MATIPKLPAVSIQDLNSGVANTALESLGIQFTAITEDYLEASMPVDRRTHQPHGILHGGASVLLAESLGSTGASLMVDRKKYICVGIEINANHISAIRSGTVIGRAMPVHVGRSTQVWEIKIRGEDGRLICISRLTLAVTEVR